MFETRGQLIAFSSLMNNRFAQEFSVDLELSSEPRELKQINNDLVAGMKTNFSMLQLLPQLIDGR